VVVVAAIVRVTMMMMSMIERRHSPLLREE
jgi:hypothetical protein